MKKLIIINGVMGVGKTTVCQQLYKELNNAVWLDGDWCWKMDPFVVNDETKTMVVDNMTHMLNNFLKCSTFDNIIFNWVIDQESIYDDILSQIHIPYQLYKITLMCSKQTLIKRIQNDIDNHIRDTGNIQRSLEKYDRYDLLDTIKVDTDQQDVFQIIDKIKKIIEEDD